MGDGSLWDWGRVLGETAALTGRVWLCYACNKRLMGFLDCIFLSAAPTCEL